VDNDFLRGVEMKAGEADEKLIEVIGDSTESMQSMVPESEDPEVQTGHKNL